MSEDKSGKHLDSIQSLLDRKTRIILHLGAFCLIPPGHKGELEAVDVVIGKHGPDEDLEVMWCHDYYAIGPKGKPVTGHRYKLMIPASV